MSAWLHPSLARRAGPFAQVADGFVGRWPGAARREFRPGAEGLRALCSQIERFASQAEVSEEEDRRFVEGAGAVLGVILIAHLDNATHAAEGSRHRVRLGRHGFFDPFSAVEQALQAVNCRRELARQVATAEAEARADGPISRVASQLVDALARQRPELAFEAQFDCQLVLRDTRRRERVELDLRRSVAATRELDDEAVARAVQRMLALLPGGERAAEPLTDVREQLLPRLARKDTLTDLGLSAESRLCTLPFSAELEIALLVAHDDRSRYLRAREAEAWRTPPGDLLDLALSNLQRRSERTRLVRHQEGPFFSARTGDGLDAARVLLASLYDELRQRVGARICLALPHRDTFLACDASRPEAVAALSRRARDDAARAPHRLSAGLFLLCAEGLRPLS